MPLLVKHIMTTNSMLSFNFFVDLFEQLMNKNGNTQPYQYNASYSEVNTLSSWTISEKSWLCCLAYVIS